MATLNLKVSKNGCVNLVSIDFISTYLLLSGCLEIFSLASGRIVGSCREFSQEIKEGNIIDFAISRSCTFKQSRLYGACAISLDTSQTSQSAGNQRTKSKFLVSKEIVVLRRLESET